jgi:hypothetical protein
MRFCYQYSAKFGHLGTGTALNEIEWVPVVEGSVAEPRIINADPGGKTM